MSNEEFQEYLSKQTAKKIAKKSKVSGVKSTLRPSDKEIPQPKVGRLKTPKIKPPSESALQAQCVAWFKAQYKHVIIFAIPNAAKRSFRLAAKMKREGMVSGIPDLFVAKGAIEFSRVMCKEDEEFHGLFIEMKRTPKDKTTDNQNHYLQKLQEAGYKTAVCHSFEEFQKVTKEYLS